MKRGDMEERMQKLEESVAHLTKVAEEISDVIARQENEIIQLKRRQSMLMKREAEREAAESGGVSLRDERPPHW